MSSAKGVLGMYTTAQVADITGYLPETISSLCLAEEIPGAIKLTGDTNPWLIPEEWAEARRAKDIDISNTYTSLEVAELLGVTRARVSAMAQGRGPLVGAKVEIPRAKRARTRYRKDIVDNLRQEREARP